MPPPRLTLLLLSTFCIVFQLGDAWSTSRFKRDDPDEHPDSHEHHDNHHSFNYTDPNRMWPLSYPACNGTKQSPINIELTEVKMPPGPTPSLGRTGYDARPKKMRIVNNGHSVQLEGEWLSNDVPTVYGGPLTGLYEIAQIHFHWGERNDVGSEHTVANQSFPLEMHMVHWKKAYDNITEALEHDDGLVVLSYLMSIDNNVNMGIEKIRNCFSKVSEPYQSTEIDPFPLSLFDLDMLKEGYVTYRGSLTTPPCKESVIWLISVRIKDVTLDQMESFRKITLNDADVRNNRPCKPLNGRDFYYIHQDPS